jgi:hypothetical protein
MKYMVLIGSQPDGWDHLSEDEQRALYQRIGAWWDEHAGAGEILEGHELQPAETATTVRVDRNGQASVTDGPFVEGKEIVGGYALIDVAGRRPTSWRSARWWRAATDEPCLSGRASTRPWRPCSARSGSG